MASGFNVVILLLIVVLVDTTTSSGASEHKWNYIRGDTNGPANWFRNYPKCGGNKQSPINIKTADAEEDSSLQPFVFSNYCDEEDVTMELTNNGHSAQVNLQNQHQIISGGGLPGQYKALQFHFHWGFFDWIGSEHTVNGYTYPLELHIVHTRVGEEDPVHNPNGLAVLAVLFQIGMHNFRLEPFFQELYRVRYAGDKVTTYPFPLCELLPLSTDRFWRYSGSLTTPGCDESVVWTVFEDIEMVSEEQMMRLRSLELSPQSLWNNFRPTQPLNGRKVLTTP